MRQKTTGYAFFSDGVLDRHAFGGRKRGLVKLAGYGLRCREIRGLQHQAVTITYGTT